MDFCERGTLQNSTNLINCTAANMSASSASSALSPTQVITDRRPGPSNRESCSLQPAGSSKTQAPDVPSRDDLQDLTDRLEIANEHLQSDLNLETSRRKRLEIENLKLKKMQGPLIQELQTLRESHKRICEKAESLAEQRDDLKAKLQTTENGGFRNGGKLLHDELLALRKTNTRLCEKAESLAEQRDELRAQLERRQDVEANLQDRLRQESGACKQEVTTLKKQLMSAMQDAQKSKNELNKLQEQQNHLQIFAKLGVDIRNRLLEWENRPPFIYPRNQSLIDAGTHCAHFGMARIDAILYQPEVTLISPGAIQRVDLDVFINLYGCAPSEIFKYKDVEELLNVLNMRCTMKTYLIPHDYETSKFKGHFRDAWVLLRNREDRSIDGTKTLFQRKTMKRHVAAMEREHVAALVENKKRRSQMKQKERPASSEGSQVPKGYSSNDGWATPKRGDVKTACCYSCGEEGHFARDCSKGYDEVW